MVVELVSESMPDKCYHEVIQVEGKQKVVSRGGCFEGWLGRKLSDGVIQLGASSWAKTMVVQRTKKSGMWLFYNFFVCVFYIGLFSYYVLKWDLWVIRS